MQTKSKKSTTRSSAARQINPAKQDDFESVARRLGCDPNLATFDAKLKKIAKAKPKGK